MKIIALTLLITIMFSGVSVAQEIVPVSTVIEVFSQKTGTSCVYDPAADQDMKSALAVLPAGVLAITCYDPLLAEPAVSDEETRIFGGFCGYRKSEYDGYHRLFYTSVPMAMINGFYDVNLRYPGQMKPALGMAAPLGEVSNIVLDIQDGMLRFDLPGMGGGKAHYVIWLVAYKKGVFSDIDEVISAINPATHMRRFGEWNGAAQSFSTPLDELKDENVAVFVQTHPFDKIVAAGRIEGLMPPPAAH